MKNVCITGTSGYIGHKLVRFLAEKDEVSQIVGIDVQASTMVVNKFRFYQRDVRENVADILNAWEIDTVIHAAFILPPIHDKQLMEDIDVNGTKNILMACQRAGIYQVL
jgi:nucleoside-diphosphate-sugar epimerase